MSGERVTIRVMLTLFALLVCALFAPVMVLLKAAEGVYVAYRITKDCVTQIWQVRGEADGLPGGDLRQ